MKIVLTQLTFALLIFSSNLSLLSQQKTYTIKTKLTSFILVPFFENWHKSMKKEECRYPKIELDIVDSNSSYDWEKTFLNGKVSYLKIEDNTENGIISVIPVIPVKMDRSLGLKSLINKFYKEYNYNENGGEAPVQFKDKEGYIYQLKDEYLGKMYEFKFKESLCDDYPVREEFFELFSVKLLQEKTKQDKISEIPVSSTIINGDSWDIFPIPFIAKKSQLGISRDSLLKVMLNTTELYYPHKDKKCHDHGYCTDGTTCEKHIMGKGSLVSLTPEYIFHKDGGIINEYTDINNGEAIHTYLPKEYFFNNDFVRKRTDNFKAPNRLLKKFYSGERCEASESYRLGNYHNEEITTLCTSTKTIGDTSTFTKNSVSNKQEHEVLFKLRNNILYGIEFELNGDGGSHKRKSIVIMPTRGYKQDPKQWEKFIEYLDKYLGKSKKYKWYQTVNVYTSERGELRVWEKGSCLLLVRVYDKKMYYYDKVICDNFAKQLPPTQTSRLNNEKFIYPTEIENINKGYWKLTK